MCIAVAHHPQIHVILFPARTAISEGQARSPPVPLEKVCSAHLHKNSARETCH